MYKIELYEPKDSEYLNSVTRKKRIPCVALDVIAEARLIASIKDAIIAGHTRSDILKELKELLVPRLTEIDIHRFINKALELFKENEMTDIGLSKLIYSSMYKDLYMKSVRVEDFSTAKSILKELTVLEGIAAQNTSVNTNITFLYSGTPSGTSEEEHLSIEIENITEDEEED